MRSLAPLPADAPALCHELVAETVAAGGDAGLLAEEDSPGLASAVVHARAIDLIQEAMRARLLSVSRRAQMVRELGLEPTPVTVRATMEDLLLIVACRGQDALYNDIAALIAELAGERPTLPVFVGSGGT